MADLHLDLELGDSRYGRFLNSSFLWEAAVGGTIMGVAVLVIIILDLSAAATICITIAVSTTYLAATLAHKQSAINAQIHASSEFVVRDLSEALSLSPDS
ncbi:MAG: hypothetical protein IH878_14175 [Gemmatimonadetes bacterium]|nr:hypothetical protein [Gemmatimonadota bacterium]